MPRNSRKFKTANKITTATLATNLNYIQGIDFSFFENTTTQPQNHHTSAKTPSIKNQNNPQHNINSEETAASAISLS